VIIQMENKLWGNKRMRLSCKRVLAALVLIGVVSLHTGCSMFNSENKNLVQVIDEPEKVSVLVNKQVKLPDNYEPEDLVEPNVHFIFKEKSEKRKMRKEAADALEELFADAATNGILLSGVSGYRSSARQEVLYNNYVKRDGKEAADRFSAKPGHSEHQTGLVMDVTGKNGKCVLMYCFSDTPEGEWLADHAHEFGFIIRYPEDKEKVTGYRHEPWHLRYVGANISKEIHNKGITLEEYYNKAVPINKGN
jgi:zinc D-Ala-D-Ala carboxypeptidase